MIFCFPGQSGGNERGKMKLGSIPLTNMIAREKCRLGLIKTMRLKGREMVCPAIAEITVPTVIRVKSLDRHLFVSSLFVTSKG